MNPGRSVEIQGSFCLISCMRLGLESSNLAFLVGTLAFRLCVMHFSCRSRGHGVFTVGTKSDLFCTSTLLISARIQFLRSQ